MTGAVPTWDASMPQAWMDRIVAAVAAEEEVSFLQAKRMVVERMEERALNAERQGLNSRTMWQQYAKMALVAKEPKRAKNPERT